MRRPLRRAALVAANLALLFVLGHAFTDGVLFPWSPVRPGYSVERYERATVVYPERTRRLEALGRVDGLVADVAAANRLTQREPITVVLTDDWGLFVRGTLMGLRAREVPVLGAAMQMGTVIWLSPLMVRDTTRVRDVAAALRHEVTHALFFQQMPLRRTFDLVKLDWFEEGSAVHFGNPGDYLDDAEWARWARRTAYRFGPQGDPALAHLPDTLRGAFRLAEYRQLTAWLIDRHGADRFFAFRDGVLADPPRWEAAFERALGERPTSAFEAFEAAVRAGRWPRLGPGDAGSAEPPPPS